ncbi:purine/pyrimidine permease [Bacillus sp. ISL-35]|uniref:purine/pyrimidine permease n=1 Tax=Bacillus sp. ISL-35 TaxID=2819122 RepID=UPI001BEA5E9B|nr:purine/pyrimidine permease [Bacillus sp. ISL-35]MBT2680846.1 purine/pyrimidine permease [Bacillus sp. ISL-35]MBT2705162.1 purine/pyrimidine permease [Chryseobacterium sp. ISL-80]
MKTFLSAIQWVAFIIAGSIVAPIAIADVFHLNELQTTGLVQRTMFVLGISSLLQALIGHRLPINEGPAGLWWGVFTIYAGLSTALFTSNIETLQALEGAMIVSGLVFFLLSFFKLIDKLAKLFTPVVSGIYLLLLVIQLSGSFLKGMMGIGRGNSEVNLPVALFSLFLVALTFYLTRHRLKLISQYAILISLAAGWLLFSLLDLGEVFHQYEGHVFAFPDVFAFGLPVFDSGLMVTSVFITFLLITNMLASIRVTGQVLNNLGADHREYRYRASGYTAGINQILGGVFSAIGSVPISGAAGFIATTGITKLLPFIISSLFIIGASFLPHVMSVFAALPAPVGYSVTFVIFANMIGIAFTEFDRENDKHRTRMVIGTSLFAGVGAMFVPAEAFTHVPPILVSILNNCLILGTLISVITDQFTKARKRKIQTFKEAS